MSEFFPPNSRLYQTLSLIVSIFLSNLVAVVGFALIFTGGVSWLMLFTLNTLLITQGSYTIGQVWRIVRRNWLVASLLWLLDLGFFALVFWEAIVLQRLQSTVLALAWGALLCLGVFLVIIVNSWMFHLMVYQPVRLEDTGRSLKLSLLLAIRYLPRSLAALVLTTLPPALMYFFPNLFWQVLGWLIFFGISFAVYLVILAQRKPILVALGRDPEDDAKAVPDAS